MAQHEPAGEGPTSGDQPADTAPRSTPQTDPTNPVTQESTGQWAESERAAERRKDEPGLTDPDRERRNPTY